MSFWIDAVGFWALVALGVISMAPALARFVLDRWRELRDVWRE